MPTRTTINRQSDWNATSGDAFIKNKPTWGSYNLDGGRADTNYGGTTVTDGGSA